MTYISQSLGGRRGLFMAALQISALSLIVTSIQHAAVAAASPKASAAAASAARGRALLTQTEAKINAAKTVSFTSTTSNKDFGHPSRTASSISCIWRRPRDISCAVIDSGKETAKLITNSEGGYVYDAESNRYCKIEKAGTPAETIDNTIAAFYSMGLGSERASGIDMATMFIYPGHSLLLDIPRGGNASVEIRCARTQLHGAPVNDITQTVLMHQKTITVHIYTDRRTNLPLRCVLLTIDRGRSSVMQVDFSAFKLSDAPIPDSLFHDTPPATATAYAPPADGNNSQ